MIFSHLIGVSFAKGGLEASAAMCRIASLLILCFLFTGYHDVIPHRLEHWILECDTIDATCTLLPPWPICPFLYSVLMLRF